MSTHPKPEDMNAIITKSMQSRTHHLPKGDIGGTVFRLLGMRG